MNMRVLNEYDARVAQGIIYLKKKFGDDWHKSIDSILLDVAFDKLCPFSQVTGLGYGKAVQHYKLTREDERDLGFVPSALFGANDIEIAEHYAMLTKAWRIALLRIRVEIYRQNVLKIDFRNPVIKKPLQRQPLRLRSQDFSILTAA